MKSDFRAGFAGLAGLLELGGGLAFFVGLLPDGAVARNFQLEPVGKRVDDGNADAVQAAGNFVGVAVEFSAGVKDGEHDFGGGTLFGGVHVDGNAAAVVDHGDGIVGVHGDVDFVGETGHGFVDRIVDNFPDQVMQTHLASGADVHGGAQTNCFEAAEHLDGFGVVLVAWRRAADRFFIAHGYSWTINHWPKFMLKPNWFLCEGAFAKRPRTRLSVRKTFAANFLKRGRRACGMIPYVAPPFDFDRDGDRNS